MNNLKEELYNLCSVFINERINAAMLALSEAQKASNDDTKSSAGDKYETSREMMKQELDRNMAQLNEANKLKISLQRISSKTKNESAAEGSIIITDNGNFYLAISAGKLILNDKIYFAVSPSSPVGFKLKGLKSGNSFQVNDKNYMVINIF